MGRCAPVERLWAAPFPLPGLADKILNSHPLAAVQHHVLRAFLYLRQVQDANEIIVDLNAGDTISLQMFGISPPATLLPGAAGATLSITRLS